MKKRFVSILLALTLILTALAGCGNTTDADSTGSAGAENETESMPPEETGESEMPSDEGENPSDEVETPSPDPETPSPDPETPSPEPGSDYIELPLGCYAGFEDSYLFGYLEVTDSTIIFYYDNGEIEAEARYSYGSDRSCTLEMDDSTVTVRFVYEQDNYYIKNGNNSRRLEPTDSIPVSTFPSDLNVPFTEFNGSTVQCA